MPFTMNNVTSVSAGENSTTALGRFYVAGGATFEAHDNSSVSTSQGTGSNPDIAVLVNTGATCILRGLGAFGQIGSAFTGPCYGRVTVETGGSLLLGDSSSSTYLLEVAVPTAGQTFSATIDVFGTITVTGLAPSYTLYEPSIYVGLTAASAVLIQAGKTLTVADSAFYLDGNLTINADVSITNGCFTQTPTPGGVLAIFTYASAGGHAIAFTNTSFTDGSQGIVVSWHWDFGDSNSSSSQNPSHTYAAAGTYTVVLTATTSGGVASTCTNHITVA